MIERLWFVPLVCMTLSCSTANLHRNETPKLNVMLVGTVVERETVTLPPNESMSGRILVGLVSGGPIVAMGAAITEEDFSKPTAFEYIVEARGSERYTIVSHSVTDIDACVEVIETDGTDLKILRMLSSDPCNAHEGEAD